MRLRELVATSGDRLGTDLANSASVRGSAAAPSLR